MNIKQQEDLCIKSLNTIRYESPLTEKVYLPLLKVSSVFGILGGSFMSVIFLLQTFVWPDDMDTAKILVHIFITLPLLGGGIISHSTYKRLRRKHRHLKLVDAILNSGNISMPEASIILKSDISDTKSVIQDMIDKELLTPLATNEGNIIYTLNGVDNKITSQSLLD